MTTENSRADALTDAERELLEHACYHLQMQHSQAACNALRKLLILAASPVEKPAAAPIDEALAYRDGFIAGARASAQAPDSAWRELCHRLYVELFHCDQQMRSTRDEDGEPHWTQRSVVRDVLAGAKAALECAPAQVGAREGLTDGRALCERLHALMPDWYPDAWEDLLPKYQRAYTSAAHPGQPEPIDMLLFCPKCGVQHVDAPEPFTPTGRCECAGPDQCEACESNRAAFEESWQNPPHRSHLCHACGNIWRPADVPTNGVAAIETRGKADTWDGKPEPRADVASEDQRDGKRWRALMKNGEPEVFVERTQRRAIQRTQPVAFSSPNLTGADRFDIPSEMWVKRYVMFAWWSRENQHRKFIEAVDAISAGDIQ
ncbi:hypothetical protein I5693_15780 [Burkholderia cenocepacia]|uniref:hypothetical protein n=1 Tax=Burkholderia cepacia complex TaxID=87882 RepID=UPI001588E3B6|nr:hypothetical protein [Burkholderia cenocepacia]MBJ9669008.1 hypothetical protein [Burkholderia cenocepacia]